MAKRKARHRATIISGGWKPPGTGEGSEATTKLVDRVDVRDPAFSFICYALIKLQSLEFELDEETIDRAVRSGRRLYEQYEEQMANMRSKHPLSAKTLQASHRSVVYYMRIGNRVKIGVTTKLATRLADINPEELLAVEPGGYDLERRRHHEYSFLRTHGEWFRLEPPLTLHIQRLRDDTLSESA